MDDDRKVGPDDNSNDEVDDDDLYGDLASTIVPPSSSNKALASSTAATANRNKKQKIDTNQRLSQDRFYNGVNNMAGYDDSQLKMRPPPQEDEIERLRTENKTLKRNISVMFRTARNELRRKDNKIKQLQEELDTLQQQQRRRG